MSNKRIVLGSGDLHYMEFAGALPELDVICKKESILGYINGGAVINYKPSTYTAKDDKGLVSKTIITEEEASLESGVMTFDAETLGVLVSTGRVTKSDDGKKRIIKVGGPGNDNGKSYVFCFHHTDKQDGDIWILIVGKNKAGFSLSFIKDKETIIDAEIICEPQDDEGTLIQYIEEILKPEVEETDAGEESTDPESTDPESTDPEGEGA